jgi:hypothetical protein
MRDFIAFNDSKKWVRLVLASRTIYIEFTEGVACVGADFIFSTVIIV